MTLERFLCLVQRFLLPIAVGFFAFFVLQRKFSSACFYPPGETGKEIIEVMAYLSRIEVELKELIEITDAAGASIIFYDSDTKKRTLILEAKDGLDDGIRGWIDLSDDPVYAQQLDSHKRGECWLVDDVKKLSYGLYRELSLEKGIQATISCPIFTRNTELVGYVKFLYLTPQQSIRQRIRRSSIQASTIVNID